MHDSPSNCEVRVKWSNLLSLTHPDAGNAGPGSVGYRCEVQSAEVIGYKLRKKIGTICG